MVTRRRISALTQRIADEFHPERVILFGSCAYGRPNADSDVDLLVILPYRGDSAKKAAEIHLKVEPKFPVDILVRTAAQVKARIAINDFFMRDIIEKGEVLYEASYQGMGSKGRGGFRHRAAGVAGA